MVEEKKWEQWHEKILLFYYSLICPKVVDAGHDLGRFIPKSIHPSWF
jgi:hypothetical protein